MSQEKNPNFMVQDQCHPESGMGQGYIPQRRLTPHDHLASLEHHISRLNNYINAMDYHGLRKRLCEDILPLVSVLEDTVNKQGA